MLVDRDESVRRRISECTEKCAKDFQPSVAAFKPKGMGQWSDVLSREDAKAIHAYIVDESWKAYTAEHVTH
jgi:predicted lipoprotein with Yx(FWY)xxD motif